MAQDRDAKINWLDWTNEAFRRARTEHKPVLLDISAVWCHWCHRLDHDTYSVPEIARYIESHFIPIRVDNDKRPDINRRYNMGGWPTTAFLTPDGRLIGGGTYFPPDKMKQILHDVLSYWEKSKEQPTQTQDQQQEMIVREPISAIIIDEILGEIANNFDPIYGGFGSQPKFPNTEAHELALLKYHYTGNREFLRIVTITLQNAGKGGVYDHEAGGFFRYSTLRDWSVPHFEKMCEDNAKWLSIYVHAYQATQDSFYLEKARGIIDYVNAWLRDSERGCFYGSQDADEEYYKLSKTERANREAPFVDKNIYTDWNAMMIHAYLESSFITNDKSVMKFALRSLERLIALNYKPGEGMYHYYDNQPRIPDQLSDQIQMTRTLCQAYEVTGNNRFLQLAEEIMKTAKERLYDTKNGGFFDTAIDPNAPGFLSKTTKPLDENSLAGRVLMKLFELTDKEEYRQLTADTLKNFTETYSQFGFMAADYGLAVDSFLNEPTLIRILGSSENPTTNAMLTEAMKIFVPRKGITLLDPKNDSQKIVTFGLQNAQQGTAYICVGRTCTAPLTEPKQLSEQISKMSAPQTTT
ncbi:MAG: thioredoxin domain-containing protein [Candidatus Bathyarchaeia archaeon]